MTKLEPSARVTGIHFDYATWHAHLAARGTPSRLVVVPRPSFAVRPTTSRPAGQVVVPTLATWRSRLTGATRAAA